MPSSDTILHQLMDVINDRRDRMPADSYTTKLFQGGTAKIGGKITEEAAEVVGAATEIDAARSELPAPTAGDVHFPPESKAKSVVSPSSSPAITAARDHLVHEAADLVYHLFVMLAFHHVTLDDVEAKLAGRFGISGLAEKAARTSTTSPVPPPGN